MGLKADAGPPVTVALLPQDALGGLLPGVEGTARAAVGVDQYGLRRLRVAPERKIAQLHFPRPIS